LRQRCVVLAFLKCPVSPLPAVRNRRPHESRLGDLPAFIGSPHGQPGLSARPRAHPYGSTRRRVIQHPESRASCAAPKAPPHAKTSEPPFTPGSFVVSLSAPIIADSPEMSIGTAVKSGVSLFLYRFRLKPEREGSRVAWGIWERVSSWGEGVHRRDAETQREER
jgi:hypothetical protein